MNYLQFSLLIFFLTLGEESLTTICLNFERARKGSAGATLREQEKSSDGAAFAVGESKESEGWCWPSLCGEQGD
jgi:hypothetical protein